MSFLLSSGGVVISIPNPQLGNTEGLSVGIDHKLSMTGVNYTYVKRRSGDKRIFSFTFENIGRGKMLEVQEFYKLHGGEEVRFTFGTLNHKVVFSADPAFSTDAHHAPIASGTGARDESGSFTLDFIEAG